jgi:hypothetical protein
MGPAINLGIFLVMLAIASETAVAKTGACPPEPGADAKSSGSCDPCAGPIQRRDAAFVIVTTLADGCYVAIWQSTFDGRVYGQCYSQAGLARGAQFRINAEAKDGILPVMVPQEDGGFKAWWEQDGKRFEQRFNNQGVPLADPTLRK